MKAMLSRAYGMFRSTAGQLTAVIAQQIDHKNRPVFIKPTLLKNYKFLPVLALVETR